MTDTRLQEMNGTDQPERTERATIPPRVDIVERDDEFVLLADVPGVRADDLDIRCENGELTLHGRRHGEQADHAGRRATRVAHQVANYHRTFRLGENVAADRITAELKGGILTLHLPKVEAIRPRKITVRGV